MMSPLVPRSLLIKGRSCHALYFNKTRRPFLGGARCINRTVPTGYAFLRWWRERRVSSFGRGFAPVK